MAEEKSQSGTRPWGVVTVEAGNDRNDSVLFGPIRERLRGRFALHNFGGQTGETLAGMPDIPGVRVRLDLRSGTGEIIDPLASDPDLLARVSNSHNAAFSRHCTARPHVVKESMDEDDQATWLYWMWRMVDGKLARVVGGEFPRSELEIRKAFPKAKINKRVYGRADGE